MDILITVGLIFLIIYCPLAFGAVHIFSFTLMEMGALLLLSAWLLKQVWNGPKKGPLGAEREGGKYGIEIESTPLYYFGSLFIGFIILQLIPLPWQTAKIISPGTLKVYKEAFKELPAFMTLSIYPYMTKINLYKVLAYVGIFFLIVNWADSKKKILGIVHALIALGTFEVIYGIIGSLGGYGHIWRYKKIWNPQFVTGTYINTNHLAGLLEIIIPLAFGLFIALSSKKNMNKEKRTGRIEGIRGFLLTLNFSDSNKAKKILVIFLTAIMILGLILSGSRGGILSLAAGFLFMSILLLFRKKFRKHAVALLIIGAIALMYGLHVGMDLTINRFEHMEQTANFRMRFAKTSMDMWKDLPVLGAGLGTFQQAYRRYKAPEDDHWEIDHVHHDWIELGAEMGWMGFGLVFLSFWFCLGYFLYLWKKRKNSFSAGIGLGGMGAMVSIALHSLTDFNMHIPANALLLIIVVGITLKALKINHHGRVGNGLKKRERKLNQERITIYFLGWLRWPLTMIIVGAFCFAVVTVVKPLYAERVFPTLPDSTVKRKAPALDDVCRAIGYENSNAEYFYQLAILLEKEDGGGQKTEDDLKKVEWAFGEMGKGAEADLIALALRRAIQLNPTNPFYHLKLARHILSKRKEKADQAESIIANAERGFERAFYFMPNSAYINLSVGSYWLWKSKIVKEEEAYIEAYDRFIQHFRKTYQINPKYKKRIQRSVKQYYPVDSVLEPIFAPQINAD